MLQWKNRVANATLTVCAFGALGAAPARAASHGLTLEGVVGALQTDSFVGGTQQFHVGHVALTGLDAPITLEQGDALSAAVVLQNGPFWVSASPNQVVGFDVGGADGPQFDDSPGAPGEWDAEATFDLGDQVVATATGSCSNCSFVAVFRSPGEAFAFDAVEVSGQFSNLSAPFIIDSARVSDQLSQPVPEPATWALWLAGLGVAGAVARRRAAA